MKSEIEISTRKSKWATAVKWLLGFITIVGFGVSIYLGFIKKTAPKLEYDILSETDFFNKRESASYIKIFIDSIDVQKNHLNISTYRLLVTNRGNDNIGYYDYDTGLFGLKIVNGSLLEPPVLLESSTDYIRTKFVNNDSIVKSSFINLPKLAIDVDDYFIVKLVVLHGENVSPKFIPEGKISGQKEITVNPIQIPQPNFWESAFSGNILVQIVRLIAYLLVAIMAIALMVTIESFVSDIIDKYKRKKIIKEISRSGKISDEVKEDYINHGFPKIEDFQMVYQDSTAEITKKYQQVRKYFLGPNKRHKKERNYETNKFKFELYTQMLENGYMSLSDDENIEFDEEKMDSVNKIYNHLRNLGEDYFI